MKRVVNGTQAIIPHADAAHPMLEVTAPAILNFWIGGGGRVWRALSKARKKGGVSLDFTAPSLARGS